MRPSPHVSYLDLPSIQQAAARINTVHINMMGTGTTVLRPVIFVVDATSQPSSHSPTLRDHTRDESEPFDVRASSIPPSSGGGETDSSVVSSTAGGISNEKLYELFVAALRCKSPTEGEEGGGNCGSKVDEEISVAASYATASSGGGAFSPGSVGDVGGGDAPAGDIENIPAAVEGGNKNKGRFTSPFSRLRVGRWRAAGATGGAPSDDRNANEDDGTSHDALARDMEEDPIGSENTISSSSQTDTISTALSSYSKNNPPVHFMSKRARIVSVGRRHAFPTSKYPRGKMADNSGICTWWANSRVRACTGTMAHRGRRRTILRPRGCCQQVGSRSTVERCPVGL